MIEVCRILDNNPVDLKDRERIGILASGKRGRQVIYKHPALLEVLAA